jgi:hypothetical protein
MIPEQAQDRPASCLAAATHEDPDAFSGHSSSRESGPALSLSSEPSQQLLPPEVSAGAEQAVDSVQRRDMSRSREGQEGRKYAWICRRTWTSLMSDRENVCNILRRNLSRGSCCGSQARLVITGLLKRYG